MDTQHWFHPKRYLAEMAGTFVLVLLGTGAIVLDEVTHGQVTHFGVSVAFGVSVMGMIYLFGKTSGAHINPAVTLSLWLAGKFEGRQVLPYVVSQIIGAFAASFLLRIIFPSATTLGETLPAPGEPDPMAPWTFAVEAFMVEFVMTFVLMFLVFLLVMNVIRIPWAPWAGGILVGILIFLEAYFGGPYSGASMNPARSLAPAIVSGNTDYLWVYLTAPFLGAFAATALIRFTKERPSANP